ncbi:MAG: tRNA (adenosine(37)-N6)-threonylcarbamoyltransferase complex dimerization subunit type 1 TsaB [Pseudomonadota bacterium]
MSGLARWLSVDTSGELCSVALSANDRVVSQSFSDARFNARRLPSAIAELCATQDLTVADIEGYVYAAGPGSFTGLRIGIALVQGLALAANAPVAGVSSLRAIAHAVLLAEPAWQTVKVINNAHMGEVFLGSYERRDGMACEVVEDALTDPAAVQDASIDGFAGDGVALCQSLADVGTPHYEGPVATAEALLEIARCDVNTVWTPAGQAQAVYLRADEAMVQKPAKRRS